MPTWKEFAEWAFKEGANATGRKALRRRWKSLRALAEEVKKKLGADEIRLLLGKEISELDPEHNDLKAIVAYAAGRGLLKDNTVLQAALNEDVLADPLYFLASISGKAFGETYAPGFAKFWLAVEGDEWAKKSARELYDVAWLPHELDGRSIRMELKASSEHPSYLFQQIRHPRMSGSTTPDYDLLLCVGVSAGSLEWWAIPGDRLDEFAKNGRTPSANAVITRHHGKDRPIWNADHGYDDEGWFRTDEGARRKLRAFACDESDRLRDAILNLVENGRSR